MKTGTIVRTASIVLCLATAACTTTDPLDGAAITYRMPRTDVVAKLSLTINDCKADKGYVVDGDLALVAKPGVGAQSVTVKGSDLVSNRIKRTLQINTGDDGVLTAINTSNADQTAAIVAGALKAAVA